MGNRKPIRMILIAALVTTGIIFLLFGADTKINQANLACIHSFGWETEEEPREITRVHVPEQSDAVYETYHAITTAAGFDITAYQGKTLTRYAYCVTNHKDSKGGMVRANVLVYRNTIVAADISSMEAGGFLQAINDVTGQQETSAI